MATHSSIAWTSPWTEEPGGLQSTGPQRVRHDYATKQQDECMLFTHSKRRLSQHGSKGPAVQQFIPITASNALIFLMYWTWAHIK